ncbi:serine/threonine-protein kinase [Dokdonella soli]|uniref:Protein kinase domain-containing protein n=1 Tax=Dokdonella soli TaxID=529810 RepID=A0ABN1ICN7_9GAMM
MHELIAARWSEIEPLLDALMDLADEERAERLARDCADDDLRAAVAYLLALDARVDSDVDQAVREIAVRGSDLEGRRIGPYRVEKTLGEGGMGAVFLATRETAEFTQHVALKLLRIGLYSAVQQELFRREQQLHARLEHPHIARIFDSGITAAGVPYFAMEYIDGLPLTEYCKAGRLDIESRLKLFATTCDAVAYAHQNLIVHRDLKPSNILVDRAGTPKLLDFGIAKLLPEAGGTGEITRSEPCRLTPNYAAPEQFVGATITTATDAYALGVLLCELLTDEPACGGSPSASMSGGMPARLRIAATACGSNVPATRPRLRGDLESIVRKATQAEPGRRYSGAAALRDDILRHLNGRPVRARPDAWTYRSAKFIQRNKFGVAAAALIAATLTGASVFSIHQADIARREAAHAQDEANRAAAVSDFLSKLFETNAPGSAAPAQTAEEMLTRAIDMSKADFTRQPRTEVELLRTIGDILRRRGQLDAARAPLDRARIQAQTLFGASADETLKATSALAALDEAEGRFAQGAAAIEQAIAAYRAQHPGDSVALAHALQLLGVLHLRSDRAADAMALEQQALDMYRRVLPDDRVEINEAMYGLAMTQQANGKLQESTATAQDVVARTRSQHGNQHVLVAEALGFLAGPLRDLGRIDAAEAAMREAVAIDRAIYTQPNPHATSDLNELALVEMTEGKFIAAAKLWAEELAQERVLFHSDHPDTATTLNNLARVRDTQGAYNEAAALQRESLAMDLHLRGEGHPYVAQSRANLARWLIHGGAFDEAERLLAAAQASNREHFGDSHPQIAAELLVEAELAQARGEPASAQALALSAIAMFEHELPPHHPKLLAARLDAGRLLLAARAFTQAEPMFAAATTDAHAGTPPVALYLAQALAGLGDVQAAGGHGEQAHASWREALNTLSLAPENDTALAGRLVTQLEKSPASN